MCVCERKPNTIAMRLEMHFKSSHFAFYISVIILVIILKLIPRIVNSHKPFELPGSLPESEQREYL